MYWSLSILGLIYIIYLVATELMVRDYENLEIEFLRMKGKEAEEYFVKEMRRLDKKWG